MPEFDFIKGFLETSFVDWEGQLVSVIFTGGCNFRCPYCQNEPLVLHPEKLPVYPLEKILAFWAAKKDWIDGVCLTGGEPTIHPDLEKLLKIFRAKNLKIKLDTNGSQPEILEKLIEEKLIDYLALDLKGPLDERYKKITGAAVDVKKIKKSLGIIKASGLAYEIRTTFVPGLVGEEELKDMLQDLKASAKFVVQNFRPKEALEVTFRKIKPYSAEELKQFAEIVRPLVRELTIRA